MKTSNSKVLFLSASDLTNHLGCKHLTELNYALANGKINPPDYYDPDLEKIKILGLRHEKAYIDYLQKSGLKVVELRECDETTSHERTVKAMKDSADIIVQANLKHELWNGRADILQKVKKPSNLGDFSYEVIDTKLAQNTKGSTILQLCLYSELVGLLQGKLPEKMHIVKPGNKYQLESYTYSKYRAYFNLIKNQLTTKIQNDNELIIYPNPVPHCQICRWWKSCNEIRRNDDHLSFVAGMSTLHRIELQRQGVHTLTEFTGQPKPLKEKPKYGTEETFLKLHTQAKLQLEGKKIGKLIYNFIEPKEGFGFYKLPMPNDGDIFFDIESDSFVDEIGLEYLFGYAYKNEKGDIQYVCKWALNHNEEKKLFEDFIDFLSDHWLKYPQMYIYHYGHYEPSALKRLMSRHNTRATELDNLLRGERFIDLHRIIKQGLQASVENYGLKDMEKFTSYKREVDLRTADSARKNIEFMLELGTPLEITKEIYDIVKLYNKDDCLATLEVRDWLEEIQIKLIERGYKIPRPEIKSEEASEKVKEQDALIQDIYIKLMKDMPDERSKRNDVEQAKWILAQILTYFQRENKSAWWDFFRMRDLTEEEFFDERKAIGGMQLKETIEPKGREKTPTHIYSFPEQEVFLKVGNEVFMPGGEKIGTISSFNYTAKILGIKKTRNTKEYHPTAVYSSEVVRTTVLEESLIEISKSVLDNGINGKGLYQASQDIICRNKPRLTESFNNFLIDSKKDLIDYCDKAKPKSQAKHFSNSRSSRNRKDIFSC